MNQPNERAWREFRPLIALFTILLGTSLLFGWVYRIDQSLDLQPWIIAVDAAVVLGFVTGFWPSVAPTLQLQIPSPRALRDTGATLVVFFVTMDLAFRSLRLIGVPFIAVSRELLNHAWPLWSVYVMHAVVPPIYEELAFRGIIQGRLEQLIGGTEAWLIQAALFSALHLSPFILLTHFGMGLAFGFTRWRTGSVYPGMLIHGLWNAWVVWQELHP